MHIVEEKLGLVIGLILSVAVKERYTAEVWEFSFGAGESTISTQRKGSETCAHWLRTLQETWSMAFSLGVSRWPSLVPGKMAQQVKVVDAEPSDPRFPTPVPSWWDHLPDMTLSGAYGEEPLTKIPAHYLPIWLPWLSEAVLIWVRLQNAGLSTALI